MKLKNIAELKRRAKWHAANDHVKQGTYGDVTKNGDFEFHGCAVGCLAMPHTKRGMRRFLSGRWDEDLRMFALYPDEMYQALTEEFGITNALAREADDLFEEQPTHGAAIEFVKNFANALNEGADITTQMVYTKETSSLRVVDRTQEFLDWLKSTKPLTSTTA